MPRDVCFYDGQCGMCQRTRRILTALDWLGRLEFQDMLTVPAGDLPVPMDQALAGMPMRTRTGLTLVGFPAVRRALLQTPLGFLPSLLLYAPGISNLARAAYNHTAANRTRACTVHTP
ncbi:MAG: DUF393 domain-containing protein [Phycisphaerales bacterium]